MLGKEEKDLKWQNQLICSAYYLIGIYIIWTLQWFGKRNEIENLPW